MKLFRKNTTILFSNFKVKILYATLIMTTLPTFSSEKKLETEALLQLAGLYKTELQSINQLLCKENILFECQKCHRIMTTKNRFG